MKKLKCLEIKTFQNVHKTFMGKIINHIERLRSGDMHHGYEQKDWHWEHSKTCLISLSSQSESIRTPGGLSQNAETRNNLYKTTQNLGQPVHFWKKRSKISGLIMTGTPSGHKEVLDAEGAVSSESKQHTHTELWRGTETGDGEGGSSACEPQSTDSNGMKSSLLVTDSEWTSYFHALQSFSVC